MKYLIFEDFSGNVVPIIFPERILHEELREQIPYAKVISGGYVYLKEGKFVCVGKASGLCVEASERDSSIIEEFFKKEKQIG